MALFGFFGYVFAHTTNIYSQRITPDGLSESIVHLEGQESVFYTADLLLLLSIVVVGILCFLTCLCVFLGYCERRDQMELKRIRDAYGLQTIYSTSNHRGYLYYLASYYRIFYTLLLLSQVFVINVTLGKCPLQGNVHVKFDYFLLSSLVVFSIYFKIKYFMNYKRIDAKPDRDNSRYIQLRNTKTGAYTDIKDVKKIMGIPFRLHDKSFIIFSDGNDDCYLPISNDKVKLPDAKELPWLYSDSIGMGMATRFDYYWNMNKKWVRRLIKVLFFVLLCIVCYISLCCLNMSQIN